MRGISNSSKNGWFIAIKTTKPQTKQQSNATKKKYKDIGADADICLACTDKKCKGTRECMERHRRDMYGKSEGHEG